MLINCYEVDSCHIGIILDNNFKKYKVIEIQEYFTTFNTVVITLFEREI